MSAGEIIAIKSSTVAKLQDQKVYCKNCDKTSTVKMIINVSIPVFCAFVKGIRCPKCGAGYRKLAL